jgi:hypothetical protein
MILEMNSLMTYCERLPSKIRRHREVAWCPAACLTSTWLVDPAAPSSTWLALTNASDAVRVNATTLTCLFQHLPSLRSSSFPVHASPASRSGVPKKQTTDILHYSLTASRPLAASLSQLSTGHKSCDENFVETTSAHSYACREA